MGLSGLGALIAVFLAYLAQSPRLLGRLGLGGRRWELRARAFTGYALALMLLVLGFFLAGVPLDTPAATPVAANTVTPTISPTPATAGEIVALTDADLTATQVAGMTPTPTFTPPSSGGSGAFGPSPTATVSATAVTTATIPSSPSPTAPLTSTIPATATDNVTATPTPSPTPTQTPLPTLTPTPIAGETAVVETGGGTLAVQRMPGGATVARVGDGDTVILQPGHANYAGELWRQIRTVRGITGWVPEAFLIE